ncbi:carboxymuconolactone decarboxylase family protein [Agriterribacter sp.]|uniref:carboxymuconolactone decarboxylase family protein n=1 Tax=Agriterribacter sp. TaxID=2821509 RepID=UPI002D06FC70|nr:carboxymuconolactone decarboxylase family protein [Agriterribacter sp.]HRO45284.1 carboxymuconolactone decarboxylase family protein [Agriterribacter sp.]HRQ19407.1 carboxymuconolactone decarboxylase family protein [Agriterribacter sp.]
MKRINITKTEPHAYKAMLGMEQYVRNSAIPHLLRELIKIRASQINGCAYCIDMHTQEALKIGETQRRIFALPAWKESPLFTEEERAVLQLTEEVTLIAKDGVSDETYNKVLGFYGKNVLAQIIMQIIVINAWNRIAVSTHQVFGEE